MAPLSVLYNWKDELDTWGHFRVVVVHGVRKEEELVRVQRGRCEVALTTYETFRLCLDQFNRYISTESVCLTEMNVSLTIRKKKSLVITCICHHLLSCDFNLYDFFFFRT